jgi:hypothetical protein
LLLRKLEIALRPGHGGHNQTVLRLELPQETAIRDIDANVLKAYNPSIKVELNFSVLQFLPLLQFKSLRDWILISYVNETDNIILFQFLDCIASRKSP